VKALIDNFGPLIILVKPLINNATAPWRNRGEP
jgi:hypothetical protein